MCASAANPAEVRILVVDDTILYRRVLSDVVTAIPNTRLVGTAPDGEIALKRIAASGCDLVLLDIEMPGRNGLDVLTEIRKRHPGVQVLIVSGTSRRAAEVALQAIELGALDFVAKPERSSPTSNREVLLRTIAPHVVAVRLGRHRTAPIPTHGAHAESGARPAAAPVLSPARPRGEPSRSFALVTIGISTGGPPALMELAPALSPEVGVPILVVQHMPPNFTAALAERLAGRSCLPIREARDGDLLEPGHVLLAPGGLQMTVRGDKARLQVAVESGPPVNGCCPSVDVLLRSIADTVRVPVLTVTMTGMGKDGVEGVRALRPHGGYNLIQSEDSCVVAGMPRAVAGAGLADETHAVVELARRINELVSRPC